MTKGKKLLTAILAVVLVATIAVGSTYAYLSAKTEELNNAFSFSDNIRGTLKEPNWDPNNGKNLTPGSEVRKDPMITNTSDNGLDEYAAVKLTFQSGNGTTLTQTQTNRLLTLIEIDWNTTDWTRIKGTATDPTQTYAYKAKLAPGAVTNPIFSNVKIKGNISDADYAWLSGFAMNHTASCYTYGTHDPAKCTITYKHHEKCAIYGLTGAENVAKGGTLNGKQCDCTPAEQHQATCPSLIGTLKPNCGHTVTDTISGYNIKVNGAVIQADQFTSASSTDAINAFNTLLG